MSQSHQIPDDVARAHQNITTLFGPSFTITDVIRYIEAIRHKEIRIEMRPMPTDISGYCISLHDIDLICTRQDLDQPRALVACLHELAHLLLGHVVTTDEQYTPCAYHVPPSSITRSQYDTTMELTAELLATLLLQGIYRQEQEPPLITQVICGDERGPRD